MRQTGIFLKRAIRKLERIFGGLVYRLCPIDETLFVFQSEGDFWDNARALYEYMISRKMNERYRLVWLVNEPDLYARFLAKNVEFMEYGSLKIRSMLREQKIMRTARYFFFTHGGYRESRRGQTVVNLWHGGVVMKAFNGTPVLYRTFDFQCSPSVAAAERMRLFTGARKEQVIINGDCRQDYLFSDCDGKVKSFLGEGYDAYVLGMPTFKKTRTWTDAETTPWILPLIKTKEQFVRLNSYCKDASVLLVLKVHHLEDTSFIDAESLSNVRVIKDDDLQEADIQLYELIGKTDALLTDFSSVAYDYMLLDRPIGYMVSEMQDYTRGFIIENIMDEMAGEKLCSLEDLEKFIRDVKTGRDSYKAERKVLADRFFTYKKDGNCERLLKILGIEE